MSELTSRSSASRGRGSGRGGRGGFAGRGARRSNGDKPDHGDSPAAFDDDGDLSELRKLYGDKTSVIREMFPDWSEADVLFALQETNGDQSEAVTRIAEGTISQWGQVSKARKPARTKVKDAAPHAATNVADQTNNSTTRPARGSRTVSEGGRGRSRATERGPRGGARGRTPQPSTNGTHRNKENQQLSVPTQDSSAWREAKTIKSVKPDTADVPPSLDVSDHKTTTTTAAAAAAPVAKTWASMLRQSTAPERPPAMPEANSLNSAEYAAPATELPLPPASIAENTGPQSEDEMTPVAAHAQVIIEEPALQPSKDDLTETNLGQVIDVSKPPATETAASTAADSWDPRQSPVSSNATPLSAAHQQHQRPPISGYAASAIKATTEKSLRTPSFQRRVMDQEEAVRMPANRELDRAAVRFGAFNLGGEGDDDVDGEREEAETRGQPPADSPVSQPRASLPPVTQNIAVPESFPPKAAGAPGMSLSNINSARANAPSGELSSNARIGAAAAAAAATAATQMPAAQRKSDMVAKPYEGSNLIASAVVAAQPSLATQQYGRFGHAGAQDPSAQKAIDPFISQQAAAPAVQPPFDGFSSATTQPPHSQGTFTSAPTDYSNYYTANQQDRHSYNNYYAQHYGQQQLPHGQHEAQQRPLGGYNASQADNLSQYPQSGVSHGQPRFDAAAAADSQNSGHSTPNPTAQTQQQQQQQQHQQHHQQQQQQISQAQQGQAGQQAQQAQTGAQGSQPQGGHGQQYPGYNHPYYPYYHQYYSGYGQGNFGPYGKGGMYGQPYGVSPNAPYDHAASSPGNFAPSNNHRDNSSGSGLGDYNRGGAAQAGTQPGLVGASSFGASHDNFARGGSTFQSQAAQGFSSQNQGGGGGGGAGASTGDDLKPFGEGKGVSGPSPSLSGVRPGSTTNTGPGGPGSGLPPPQTSQMGGGYGGYPSHLQGHGGHGSGAYGMGAGTGGNQHGNTPYGSYGGQGFGSGGYYAAAGQQQQRGWGGNYH